MNEATAEDILKSIVPKSDQLNADDLVDGPITVTITGVRASTDERQPIIVDIAGHRPYKPCKTMLRVLREAYTKEAKCWIGKRMTLFRDADVMWSGIKVGGIRISHLSGFSQPKTFVVTLSRTRKAEIVIYPVTDAPSGDSEAIAKARSDIAAATTKDELKAVGLALKTQPKAVQDAVRSVYAARQKTLANGSTPQEPPPGHRQYSASGAESNGFSATLAEWKTGIAVCRTLDHIAEFRHDHLPGCPTHVMADVEKMLADREEAIKQSVSQGN